IRVQHIQAFRVRWLQVQTDTRLLERIPVRQVPQCGCLRWPGDCRDGQATDHDRLALAKRALTDARVCHPVPHISSAIIAIRGCLGIPHEKAVHAYIRAKPDLAVSYVRMQQLLDVTRRDLFRSEGDISRGRLGDSHLSAPTGEVLPSITHPIPRAPP